MYSEQTITQQVQQEPAEQYELHLTRNHGFFFDNHGAWPDA